jgi:hypothetical protein
MTDLIACLSTGKGTWAHVSRLIEEQEWDNIFLITNEFGKENFQPKKQVEYILINSNRFLSELAEDIKAQLKEKVNPADVAVNLISGSGKEHMAIISALLKLGLGIRLITLTPRGIKEI